MDEVTFRTHIYMAAVCRCFPGKRPGGGDRVPDADEIANCSGWMKAEMELLRPGLVIAVGKLAILQFIPCGKLDEVIGKKFEAAYGGRRFDLVPLPHPSGASPWPHQEPGRVLLPRAMRSSPRIRRGGAASARACRASLCPINQSYHVHQHASASRLQTPGPEGRIRLLRLRLPFPRRSFRASGGARDRRGYLAYNEGMKLTTTTPADITNVDGGDTVFRSAQQKIADFNHDVKNRQAATLTLSADEINTLIAENPEVKSRNIRANVVFSGKEARLQCSVPTDSITPLRGSLPGRYANFDTTFEVQFDPGTKSIIFDFRKLAIGPTTLIGEVSGDDSSSRFVRGFSSSSRRASTSRSTRRSGKMPTAPRSSTRPRRWRSRTASW